ncbi:MAG: hypothetical protein QXG03_06035 [Halalkalicoccus sp.]
MSTTADLPTRSETEPPPLRLITHDDGEPLAFVTAVPAETDEETRFTAWLSVERDCVVDLEEWR